MNACLITNHGTPAEQVRALREYYAKLRKERAQQDYLHAWGIL